MNTLHSLYDVLDLSGTFVFALSGAIAARQKGLDLFGVLAIAFTVACGGGIIRDICIGAIPPEGLSNWRYLITAMLAATLVITLYHLVLKIKKPVLLFDALGLALFAVTGASKVLTFGWNSEVAILLGTTTAVGGGVLRDILLNRVPVILQKEIYASAALLGSVVIVIGNYFLWPKTVSFLAGFTVCFVVRFLALHYNWNLTFLSKKNSKAIR